ncbi:MAG: hypothetical protein EOP56_07105 [Sphingobacteriales bacterium]|nr:MAG: hypothetical protein EOP56_07105 [Sphingobacteriales bacterium]
MRILKINRDAYIKTLSALLLLLLVSVSTQAQSFAIANEKLNFVYWGIPNKLYIAVENFDCRYLKVFTDNGTIVQKKKCAWELLPARHGGVNLTLCDSRYPMDTLGTMYMSTKDIPKGEAMLAGKHSGHIPRSMLRGQGGIYASLTFDYDIRLIITAYTCTIFRGDIPVFSGKTTGYGAFSEEMKKEILQVKGGDSLLFSQIKARPVIEPYAKEGEPIKISFLDYPEQDLEPISFIVD